MSAKTKTNSKSKFPTAAQIARQKARLERLDALIAKRNAANHEALALALPALIAKNPRVEFEIVSNYLRRNNKYMVDRDEHHQNMRRIYPNYDAVMKSKAPL